MQDPWPAWSWYVPLHYLFGVYKSCVLGMFVVVEQVEGVKTSVHVADKDKHRSSPSTNLTTLIINDERANWTDIQQT